jgi:hypothetical protein
MVDSSFFMNSRQSNTPLAKLPCQEFVDEKVGVLHSINLDTFFSSPKSPWGL